MDRFEDLCKLIVSLKNQTFQNMEIVVVVEDSEELQGNITRFIKEQKFSKTSVLLTKMRVGSSYQVNLGAEKAKGPIIAYLHDDTVVDCCWAENLLKNYSDPAIIGVTGPIIPNGNNIAEWFPEEFDWIIGCNRYFVRLMPKKKLVRSVSGSNASFRKNAFISAGGLSTLLGPLSTIKSRWCEIGEETELCLRVTKKCSGHLLYDPQVVVYHKIPPENLRYTFIARMSYQAGRTKGGLKVAYKKDRNLLEPEGAVLHQIYSKLLPSIVMDAFKKPAVCVRKSMVVGISFGFLSFGFLTGYFFPSSLIVNKNSANKP
jgi:GT2 family glycosyltransferase